MVELSTFIGQIVSDMASARTAADSFAAGASERYHADPFVKNLPIPHYIIESAEIDVPVMVVGVLKSADEFAGQREQLFEAMREKLPVLLLRTYKYSYYKSKEADKLKESQKNRSRERMRAETTGEQAQTTSGSPFKPDYNDALLEAFVTSAKEISEKLIVDMGTYLDSYNYELIKILDLTDEFMRCLEQAIKLDVADYKKENRPYADESGIQSSVKFVGNLMFFEFKRIMHSNAAVQVDVNTVQMNEYSTQDCLMRIKLKIKEQDLSLLVEEDEAGREKRYLSLS